MPARSRYRADAPPDYGHRFHAGNVGDVWKHCVLLEILRRVRAAADRVVYLDTHAGEGTYRLGPTGEWTDGVGRLWDRPATSDVVGRWLAACRRVAGDAPRPDRYPGSPALARAALGASGALRLWERDPATCERLRRERRDDPAATIACADGLAALPDAAAAAEREADAVVALVDPPYGEKADWTTVPDAFARADARARRACLVLWYPVKSLTRPNAMIARLAAAGVRGAFAELLTTPLAHQRRRLNGSAVLVVRPPAGALEAVAAAAPVVGRACATHDGWWSFRMQSWSGPIGG